MNKILSFISKKFLTLCISTWLLWYDKINEYTWLAIAMVYMGIQTGIDILEKLKDKKEI